MKTVPQEYNRRLADIGGRLPNGKPKLRLIYSPETKRAHGSVAGQWKYPDPMDVSKPLPWWFLEMWIAPEMCGTREAWPYDLLGPYPADCGKECCDNGFWGLKTPITTNGEFIELSEATMQAIEQKQFMDLQFALLTETQRLEFLTEQKAAADQRAAAKSWEQHNQIADDYAYNKEKEDGADSRVTIFMDPKLNSTRDGAKLPAGNAVEVMQKMARRELARRDKNGSNN